MGKIPLIQTCYNLANVLGCCCNYNDIREIMLSNEREWCEKCDRNTPVEECWYRYFKIRNKERVYKEKQTDQVKDSTEIDNGYKCQICGALFELNKANRYLIEDDEAPIMAIFSVPATYECFDCPKCGCQNRVNERKGSYIIDKQVEDD